MNHVDIKKHLADYLEGELAIDERALVDAHLDACDSCTREVDEMLQTIRLLRTLPEPEIPPMIAANVMRRIRSGENQLGILGRMGRALGGILEPSFVLPASAIAAAALVVTVVQGLGIIPTSEVARDSRSEEHRLIGGVSSSVASVSPSIASSSRRGDRAHAHAASDASDGMDFVARVERRATQSDRAHHQGSGQYQGPGQRAQSTATGSGARIRIRLEGLGLAQESTSQQSTARRPQIPMRSVFSGSSFMTARTPDVWTTDFSSSSSSSRNRSGEASGVYSPGQLVVAERFGAGHAMARSGVWPQAAQGEFLTSSGNGEDPRDAWLALGFEDPAEFARYIAGRNLAEQELWAARLSERAEAQGFLDEFLQALRDSGDPTASWVADDFSAQAERTHRRRILSEAEDHLTR